MSEPVNPSKPLKLVGDPESAVAVTGLCDADAQALDALIAARCAGSDFVAATADDQDRLARCQQLMAILDRCPAEAPPADLTRKTLDRIRNERQRERFAQQVQMLAEPRQTIGVSWRQVLSAAAVFLIAVSLLFPVLDRNHEQSQRVMGAANLGSVGNAFSQYSIDHRNALPQREARPGETWWNVGQPVTEHEPVRSNSAHLYVLVRTGRIDPDLLNAPTNPDAPAPGTMTREDHDWHSPEAVSYSYQNVYRHDPIDAEAQVHLSVLADRNPIFVIRNGRIAFDPSVSKQSNSRLNHGKGQNVLLLDGRVLWLTSPDVHNPRTGEMDNIWGAQGKEVYEGNEVPADAEDSMLVP